MLQKECTMSRRIAVAIGVALSFWLSILGAHADSPSSFQYVSPMPGSTLVSAGTTIAVRQGETMDPASISVDLFQVTGSRSGDHAGRALLATDNQTVIFTPDRPFAPDETVSVALGAGLRTAAGQTPDGLSFEFRISPKAPAATQAGSGKLSLSLPLELGGGGAPQNLTGSVGTEAALVMPRYLTAPSDLPAITVTVPVTVPSSDLLFMSDLNWGTGPGALPGYLLIVQENGELVYYQNVPSLATDFKKQPNSTLTYYDVSAQNFKALNSNYGLINTYAAGNGYMADLHELQVSPTNGHALLLIYDPEPVDMSQIVTGGQPNASVVGLIIQELDTAKHVVFQWRSWDHFNITDSTEPITGTVVDYVHGNAIDVDTDGNLLLSSRHLDEITKINRQTGAIIWRMGGKNNQFTFTNSDPSSHQHDIRRIANGHVTLFDNGNGRTPQYSRAVEFALDEVNKTATSVWQYRNTPDSYAEAMGDAQRLANGNTLIGWGSAHPTIIEARPDGAKAFELQFGPVQVSYRAFRFPWEGLPTWAPTLMLQTQGVTSTLYYSWNGATDVASYQIYGGTNVQSMTLLGTQTKTGFEMSYDVTADVGSMCFFRVMPIDNQGHATQYSNLVSSNSTACPLQYLPLLRKNSIQ
jgi:hypothetical protein